MTHQVSSALDHVRSGFGMAHQGSGIGRKLSVGSRDSDGRPSATLRHPSPRKPGSLTAAPRPQEEPVGTQSELDPGHPLLGPHPTD